MLTDKDFLPLTLILSQPNPTHLIPTMSTLGYAVIDTVGEASEGIQQTHARVRQQIMAVPLGQQIKALSLILDEQKKLHPGACKVMVFFPTARQTAYMAALFSSMVRQ